MLIFAPVKTKKDNENNIGKYILVVASVTTPTVVREQCSYVYIRCINKEQQKTERALSHQATGLFSFYRQDDFKHCEYEFFS